MEGGKQVVCCWWVEYSCASPLFLCGSTLLSLLVSVGLLCLSDGRYLCFAAMGHSPVDACCQCSLLTPPEPVVCLVLSVGMLLLLTTPSGAMLANVWALTASQTVEIL